MGNFVRRDSVALVNVVIFLASLISLGMQVLSVPFDLKQTLKSCTVVKSCLLLILISFNNECLNVFLESEQKIRCVRNKHKNRFCFFKACEGMTYIFF